MSDGGSVSVGGGRREPHGAGGEWLSFEVRMRRRRAATCIHRAERALEDGDVAQARAALSEARELAPHSADVDALERRLEQLPTAPRGWSPTTGALVAALRSRRTPIVYGVSGLFLMLLTAAGMSFAIGFWPASTPSAGHPNPGPAVADVPAPAPTAGAGPAASSTPDAGALRVIYETVRVAEATPRLVEELPPTPALPGPPVADAEPTTEPAREPVVLAVNRSPTPPQLPDSPPVRSELPAEALRDPAHPVRLGVPAPPTTPAVSGTAGASEAVVPARGAATAAEAETSITRPEESAAATPPARDESAVVRTVLRQYERAYSSLDAAAASAVWPKVNRNDLARAFEGLASQRVSLGSCDVDINGPAARATCSGSATWEPKVGGGLRTEPRRWNFELRKSGDGWQIQRAIARSGG